MRFMARGRGSPKNRERFPHLGGVAGGGPWSFCNRQVEKGPLQLVGKRGPREKRRELLGRDCVLAKEPSFGAQFVASRVAGDKGTPSRQSNWESSCMLA